MPNVNTVQYSKINEFRRDLSLLAGFARLPLDQYLKEGYEYKHFGSAGG